MAPGPRQWRPWLRTTRSQRLPTAINTTDAAAHARPASCHAEGRSCSTVMASSTVNAGYSEVMTTTTESSDDCAARKYVIAPVSESAPWGQALSPSAIEPGGRS